MDGVTVDLPVALQVLQSLGVIWFLWWRMGRTDKRIEDVAAGTDKRLQAFEERMDTELMRIRDRLHRLEGQPRNENMMEVLKMLADERKELISTIVHMKGTA